jgi:hypothetical protein
LGSEPKVTKSTELSVLGRNLSRQVPLRFKIKARQIGQGPVTRKGYVRSDFTDAFRRYLPSATPEHR